MSPGFTGKARLVHVPRSDRTQENSHTFIYSKGRAHAEARFISRVHRTWPLGTAPVGKEERYKTSRRGRRLVRAAGGRGKTGRAGLPWQQRRDAHQPPPDGGARRMEPDRASVGQGQVELGLARQNGPVAAVAARC